MRNLYIQRYLITGLFTLIPIWLTWLIFKFVFSFLSEVSAPWVSALFLGLSNAYPQATDWLNQRWLQSILAFVSTIVTLYLVGFATNRVFGKRLLNSFDQLISRIPVVHTIYGGTKKLMSVLSNKPAGTQRVVLINFPSPELKTVGFVTRVFEDDNGNELAAVYVPTTPNPTGGYLEIVPLEKLTATDWTVDQAMAFILSCGAILPEKQPLAPARSNSQ